MKRITKYMIAVFLISMLLPWSTQAKTKSIVNCTSQKYTYSQMKKDIKQLAKRYPDYCSYTVLGVTKQKRNIYDVAIGNPNAEKSILVVSTVHAREYVCSATMMRIAEYYLKNYNKSIHGMKPSEVFDNVQLHMIVMANPDGVHIAQYKNPNWKSNSKGVDINRNFPIRFKIQGKKGLGGYSGKKANSEEETKAIIRLAKQLKADQQLCAEINYHAMGNIIFGSYSGKNKRIKRETTKMYKIARKETGYRDSAGYVGSSSGDCLDYMLEKIKVPSITIEVGTKTCPVPYHQYDRIFDENKDILIQIARLY